MSLQQEIKCSRHTDGREDEKQDRVKHFLSGARAQGTLCLRLRLQSHYQAGNDDIGDGQREEEFPAEGHQLIVTETWQCAANPNINKDKKEYLYEEPKQRRNHHPDSRYGK